MAQQVILAGESSNLLALHASWTHDACVQPEDVLSYYYTVTVLNKTFPRNVDLSKVEEEGSERCREFFYNGNHLVHEFFLAPKPAADAQENAANPDPSASPTSRGVLSPDRVFAKLISQELFILAFAFIRERDRVES